MHCIEISNRPLHPNGTMRQRSEIHERPIALSCKPLCLLRIAKSALKIVFPHKSFYCIKGLKRYLLKNDMIKDPDFEDSGT